MFIYCNYWYWKLESRYKKIGNINQYDCVITMPILHIYNTLTQQHACKQIEQVEKIILNVGMF